MKRVLSQEILETLDDDDPAAIKGRKDLLWVNGIMGNHRWVAKTLRRLGRPEWSVLEIGAGDGALGEKLITQGICRPSQLHAMDLSGQPASWPSEAHWKQGDLFKSPLPETEIVVANLFLHHFEGDQLGRIGRAVPTTVRLMVAAEPARYAFHRIQGGLFCKLMRLHEVTRHDMMVSIGAGFRGDELGKALNLGPDWTCRAWCTVFGAYRFVAERSGSALVRPMNSGIDHSQGRIGPVLEKRKPVRES